jgi:hypothetical protein
VLLCFLKKKMIDDALPEGFPVLSDAAWEVLRRFRSNSNYRELPSHRQQRDDSNYRSVTSSDFITGGQDFQQGRKVAFALFMHRTSGQVKGLAHFGLQTEGPAGIVRRKSVNL